MLVGPGEIQTIGIEAFEKINAASWVANASLWSEAGTATPLRNDMLAEVDAVVARETARLAYAPRLVDLGCADGGYLARLHDAFDALGDAAETAAHFTGRLGLAHDLQQAHRARVDAMPAVAEAGNDLAVRGDEAVDAGFDLLGRGFGISGVQGDVLQQFHALLAGTAMVVAEHVDASGDR